jgi:hypothetical protein
MAIKNSGPSLSFSEIVAEFGLPPGRNLGAYRVSQNVGTLTNLPLDIGIPQSGAISFDNFYSKKLNVVVDLYSFPNYSTRLIARSRYNDNGVVVIGGFRGKPASSTGIRVIVNINGIVGSDKSSINSAAVITGGWEDNTQLELEIGSGAQLIGAGGDGGTGGGGGGQSGSSALGIQYPSIIRNRGYIQAGSGGGGGSGSVNSARRSRTIATRRRTDVAFGGNGGGGGAGIPIGAGGPGGAPGGMERRRYGASGSNAVNQFTGGNGGDNESGQVGGAGGSSGGDGGAGGGGGGGGSQGRAIIFYNDGSGSTITNLGTIQGPIIFNTTPT